MPILNLLSLSFVSTAVIRSPSSGLSFAAHLSVAPNGIKPSADQEAQKERSIL